MITKWRTEVFESKSVEEIVCDRCKKVIDDPMEIQEAFNIRFTGGYSSVFGDCSTVSCDLCQQCLKELIGNFCRYDED